MSNVKEVNTSFFSISNQEQTTPIFNQSATQTDFIGTDLLELTEDDISHFEKKFVATLKTASHRDDYSADFSDTILASRIKLANIFIHPYSSIQSFIGVYRI